MSFRNLSLRSASFFCSTFLLIVGLTFSAAQAYAQLGGTNTPPIPALSSTSTTPSTVLNVRGQKVVGYSQSVVTTMDMRVTTGQKIAVRINISPEALSLAPQMPAAIYLVLGEQQLFQDVAKGAFNWAIASTQIDFPVPTNVYLSDSGAKFENAVYSMSANLEAAVGSLSDSDEQIWADAINNLVPASARVQRVENVLLAVGGFLNPFTPAYASDWNYDPIWTGAGIGAGVGYAMNGGWGAVSGAIQGATIAAGLEAAEVAGEVLADVWDEIEEPVTDAVADAWEWFWK